MKEGCERIGSDLENDLGEPKKLIYGMAKKFRTGGKIDSHCILSKDGQPVVGKERI